MAPSLEDAGSPRASHGGEPPTLGDPVPVYCLGDSWNTVLVVRVEDPLIERDAELASVDQAIAAALAGEGHVLVLEGPAGIGKTALLDEARRRAAAQQMVVVSAQGAVLEHDFGFGVVRQLFEPILTRTAAAERSELLAGAAELAGPVIAPELATDAPPSQQPAVLHGLYWLTANLADRGPLLLVVDDLHWCDPPSVQFLAYLARRLEGMSVGVLVGLRSGDPQAEPGLIDEFRAGPGLKMIRLAPLSGDGVRRLVRARLGEPDQRFVDVCVTATGGVPFLVDELLRVLQGDGVGPTAEGAERIAQVGPRTVAHATMLRLARLSPAAVSVAQAVAVLGRQARPDRVAGLAGTDLVQVQAAVESLVAMEVLAPGAQLAFSHGLVRQAVYDDMASATRANAHGRVADLLAAEHAPADEVAAHLLLSHPGGRPEVVQTLQAAAREVLARGAPASAVSYLRRAVAEGGAREQELAGLLHELGGAEAFARDPRAAEDLEEAYRLVDDPVMRAWIGWELAQVQLLSGGWGSAMAVLGDVFADLGERDPDLEAQIEGWRAASEVYDPARAGDLDSRVDHLRAIVDRGGPGTRMLALILAVLSVFGATDAGDARALIDHGLDDGGLLRDEGSESLALVQGISALVGLDDIDGADKAMTGVFDDAAQRGSIMGYLCGCFYRTLIEAQRGRLQAAESYFRSMVEQALENGIMFAVPSAIWAGTDVLLERAGVDDLAVLVDSLELDPTLLATISGGWVLAARGRLRIAQGRRSDGIADLRGAGEIFDRARIGNPIAARWRSPLALALPEEARDEARDLVAEELGEARRRGLARCEGVALRTAGVLEGGTAGIERLQESLRTLEAVDAPLERARTLVELGAALRRSNQRMASREPLAAGLELAHVCGAERLASRAVDELRASGARPRRAMSSGPDALTSAEARVARMAAEGMTNREIAQALFVTAKTVENQLGVVYRKLRVGSRDQLGSVFSPELSD